MNLLGPLDSNGRAFFLPFDIADPTQGQTWEGFDYLGFGAILLVLWGGVALFRRWPRRNRTDCGYGAFPLSNGLLLVLILFLLSLSHRISMGAHVFEVPLPEQMMVALGKFRATGRFFWVCGFMLVLVSAVVLAKALGASRLNLILGVLVVVQLLDIRPIALFVRESMQTAVRYPPLAIGPGKLSMIHVHPPWQCDPWKTPAGVRNYESIGYTAVARRVPTNHFYAARNPAEQVAYHCDTGARLAVLDPAGVYVLDEETYVARKPLFEKSHSCWQEQMQVKSTHQQALLSGLPVDRVFWVCEPGG
jgi:rhodanese-related sulfurtransferase